MVGGIGHLDPSMFEQNLDVGMIPRPLLEDTVTEAIQTTVATMQPAHAIRLNQQHDNRTMRIQGMQKMRSMDQRMHFLGGATQEGLSRLLLGQELSQALLGGLQHLLGRLCATGMPTHSVSQHNQCDSLALRMRQERQSILLLPSIADVLTDTGINSDRAHRKPLTRQARPP